MSLSPVMCSRLKSVIGMGIGAGAYILTRFAVSVCPLVSLIITEF